MPIIDIHTHILPSSSEALYCLPSDLSDVPDTCYCSAGIHPWNAGSGEDLISKLASVASAQNVLAIGECGFDRLRGPSLAIQEKVFTAQFLISERLQKPMILHIVKSSDIILMMRKRLLPSLPWLIHGFRGGAVQARQLTDAGLMLSFGPDFNEEAVRSVGLGNVLLETDGHADISLVLEKVAVSLNVTPDVLSCCAAANAARFLGISLGQ